MKPIAIALLLLFFGNIVDAQQVIGAFPQMDGGFEAQTVATLPGTPNSHTPLQNFWSRATNSGGGSSAIFSTGARSGTNRISVVNTSIASTTNSRTILSSISSITSGKSYIIQFYCKAADSTTFPNTKLQVGLSSDTVSATFKTFIPVGNPAAYNKYFVVDTSLAVNSNNGFAAIKISSDPTNNAKFLDIDDWVVYPGTELDTLSPSNPGPALVSNPTATSLDVSWVPSADIDGGGYLVIRYSSDPTNEPNPNVNGIYQVGNTIGNGTVAISIADACGNSLSAGSFTVQTANPCTTPSVQIK
jgi:hypothetical protein